MRYEEAKREFIQTWGKLGSEWGINRTMAQVHALLLISAKPLSTEEVMEDLNISRGNANMNLRELITWDLISKELVPGERREYFKAEKDIWEIAKRITEERKRREIEPVKKTLEQLKNVEGEKGNKDIQEFIKVIKDLSEFVSKMDKTMNFMLKAEESRFFGNILKLIQ